MAVALPTDPAPVNLPPATPLTDCEQLAEELAKYPGWDQAVMLAVAKAESKNHNCNPTGHNLTNSEDHGVCVGSYGALQVGCVHYAGEDPNDLKINVKIAHRVWTEQGYHAWTQYREGVYLRFL